MTRHEAFLALYDSALPQVYGYLVRRCDSAATAEDLTAETFMAAVTACQRGDVLSVGWLITTARHKLIDHWRRLGRQRDAMAELIADLATAVDSGEPLPTSHAAETLAELAPLHRSVLSLRYLDGLPVGEVAAILGRTIHATESLLTRAKVAFRTAHADLEEAS